MKPLLVSFLGLFLIASSTPRPAQLLSVFPPEESTQTHVRYVSADVSEPSSLQLFVDGVDVTSLSKIANTRDGCIPANPGCPPPSQGGIYYTPNGLEPGSHHAQISFQTKQGKTMSYIWSFSIESPWTPTAGRTTWKLGISSDLRFYGKYLVKWYDKLWY